MTKITTRPLRPGMRVFDRDRAPLGEVAEVATNYFILEKGAFLVPAEAYVPTSAIGSIDEDNCIYLALDQNEAESQEWSAPPVYEVDYSEYAAARASDFESDE